MSLLLLGGLSLRHWISRWRSCDRRWADCIVSEWMNRAFRETLQKQEPRPHGGWKEGQLVTVLREGVDGLPRWGRLEINGFCQQEESSISAYRAAFTEQAQCHGRDKNSQSRCQNQLSLKQGVCMKRKKSLIAIQLASRVCWGQFLYVGDQWAKKGKYSARYVNHKQGRAGQKYKGQRQPWQQWLWNVLRKVSKTV